MNVADLENRLSDFLFEGPRFHRRVQEKFGFDTKGDSFKICGHNAHVVDEVSLPETVLLRSKDRRSFIDLLTGQVRYTVPHELVGEWHDLATHEHVGMPVDRTGKPIVTEGVVRLYSLKDGTVHCEIPAPLPCRLVVINKCVYKQGHNHSILSKGTEVVTFPININVFEPVHVGGAILFPDRQNRAWFKSDGTLFAEVPDTLKGDEDADNKTYFTYAAPTRLLGVFAQKERGGIRFKVWDVLRNEELFRSRARPTKLVSYKDTVLVVRHDEPRTTQVHDYQAERDILALPYEATQFVHHGQTLLALGRSNCGAVMSCDIYGDRKMNSLPEKLDLDIQCTVPVAGELCAPLHETRKFYSVTDGSIQLEPPKGFSFHGTGTTIYMLAPKQGVLYDLSEKQKYATIPLTFLSDKLKQPS